MKRFKHYVLTRFNAGLYSNPDRMPHRLKRLDAWMKHRLILYENFTLPSIKNQSCQNFSWLLLVDEQTPERFKKKIESFKYSNIEICYTNIDIYSPNISDTKIWGIDVYENNDFDIITTRIDNDDAFHVDFIKDIQCKYVEMPRESKPFLISFPLGYIMDLKANQIILHRYPGNSCPSLVSPSDKQNFRSVFCCVHNLLGKKYKVTYIQEEVPHWLLIIHSQNLGNQKHRKFFNALNEMKISKSILRTFGISKSGQGGKFYGSTF